MGTKRQPGRFDCYANAASDEPMFILLGRDWAGPWAVRCWIVLRALMILLRIKPRSDWRMLHEARTCAAHMTRYRRRRRSGEKPSGMSEERAREIVGAITDRRIYALGGCADVRSLEGISLTDMLVAKAIVAELNRGPAGADGKRTVQVVPDDGLIAAAYALERQPRGIAVPGRSLVVQ